MTPCVEWSGRVALSGYGVAKVDGKNQLAHRLAWREGRGEIPAGLLVCHSCDNRTCVNLEHLFLGTHLDNNRDMLRKGRDGLVGEKNPRAKLSLETVRQIRWLLVQGFTPAELAESFNISKSNIFHIQSGRNWNESPAWKIKIEETK